MKQPPLQALLHLLYGMGAASNSSEPGDHSWKVDYWQSTHCTSARTATLSGADAGCHQIPFYGVTASLIYRIRDSDHHLLLYENKDCSGDIEVHQCMLTETSKICLFLREDMPNICDQGVQNRTGCIATGWHEFFRIDLS